MGSYFIMFHIEVLFFYKKPLCAFRKGGRNVIGIVLLDWGFLGEKMKKRHRKSTSTHSIYLYPKYAGRSLCNNCIYNITGGYIYLVYNITSFVAIQSLTLENYYMFPRILLSGIDEFHVLL